MLCFTNSKFFSLTYELQQTSQFRGNLWTASNFRVIPRMNHHVPTHE
jgi:hypothetical protein